MVFDQDDYGYARDSQGNVTAISYGEQVRSGMWGSDWRVMAAENIDGVNSVIWKARGYGGPDSFWLSLHDQNWEFYDSMDPGWPGDPRYGEAADDQFYITETDFNIDFNNDGNIGAPPNNDPLLTGIKATLADGQQNNSYTIFHDQLLQGFSDPDGDFLSIEEGSLNVNNLSLIHI